MTIDEQPGGRGPSSNLVISGRVRWSIVGPNGTSDSFEGRARATSR